jgi:dTDP-glucose 4,6-dehydratase
MILVTGGAGFIGSNFILEWFRHSDEPLINLDVLTYAGNPENLAALRDRSGYLFVHGDICDAALLGRLLHEHAPRAIVHFAAESHVDRSILGPAAFIRTNVEGTFQLLEAARKHHERRASGGEDFRFLHVSTDEVYGSLDFDDAPFTESHPFAPNSPYSASKASSDHLVRSWFHTFGLPVLTGNCSNNYGPYQFPEKLIPLMISNALEGRPLPVYGDGRNVRDWLYVTDHCAALRRILEAGTPGETYNVGGGAEKSNLDLVHALCDLLDELRPDDAGGYRRLITFVKDRPGHDRRYAIDASKLARELGWRPQETFESGLEKTVRWYLDNPEWLARVKSGAYREWLGRNYTDRGLSS